MYGCDPCGCRRGRIGAGAGDRGQGQGEHLVPLESVRRGQGVDLLQGLHGERGVQPRPILPAARRQLAPVPDPVPGPDDRAVPVPVEHGPAPVGFRVGVGGGSAHDLICDDSPRLTLCAQVDRTRRLRLASYLDRWLVLSIAGRSQLELRETASCTHCLRNGFNLRCFWGWDGYGCSCPWL